MFTLKKIKRVVIGRPLKNKLLLGQKYNVLWGLPVLSSDAISSVAYAGQEILLVLMPAIGVLSYMYLSYISLCIIGLLVLLTLSYSQTIDSYPNGGGAYIVAKDNLGTIAGIVAGAALCVDYILTVAVSVSSGIEQISSAFPIINPYVVPICIFVVLLLMVGNLRGIRESSRIFGVPAYCFMFGMLAMLVVGFIKVKTHHIIPMSSAQTAQDLMRPVSIFLILKAFSSGCTALTGVEAVTNAVPSFKEPSTKYAKRVLFLLALVVFVLFGGTSLLANMYQIHLGDKTMLIALAQQVFGENIMFYYITATTFIILAMAANTAYSGFPLLVSVMASEGYAPRQLSMRGDRLSYSNGIIILSIVAMALIVLFKAKVTSLIGLYAIGVFISFTLSQLGMFMKWKRDKGPKWRMKAFVNGLGALVTAIAVIIIAVAKFKEGAYIVVIVIPVLVYCMEKIKSHYTAIANQLRIQKEEEWMTNITDERYRNRVIVPIQSVNRASIRAVKYARTISDNVVAFNVAVDEESERKIKEAWSLLDTDVKLIVKYSPFRRVVGPLLKFIESAEYGYRKGDMITVILAQFTVSKWWHVLLHNRSRVFIEKELLKHKHIVVATMPLKLK